MKKFLNSFAGFLPLGVLWLGPLMAGLLAVLYGALDGEAWLTLFEHPQLWPALALSIGTGTLSLIISALLAFWIVAGLYGGKLWAGSSGLMGGFLSLPHLAFAIGFGFLITPSGFIARVIGSIAGWAVPPQWVTTQDPYGLSLVAVLVLKEVPFLIWLISALLARPDISQMLKGHFRVSQSLGHGGASVWLRVFIPQILPRLKWPLLIVWFYGASVVDVALAIGPTQPPPLSVIIWSDLNNADPAFNARGTAGALFLTAVLVGHCSGLDGPEKNYPPLNLEIFYPRPFAAADPRDHLQRPAVFLLRDLRHGFCNPVCHVHWHPVALPKSFSHGIALERLAPVSHVAGAASEQPVTGLCVDACRLGACRLLAGNGAGET